MTAINVCVGRNALDKHAPPHTHTISIALKDHVIVCTRKVIRMLWKSFFVIQTGVGEWEGISRLKSITQHYPIRTRTDYIEDQDIGDKYFKEKLKL